MRRIQTGSSELDFVLHGGVPRHSINIIAGLPGSGKTILAQQLAFATGTLERPVLYLSTVSEPQAKIIGYLQELAFVDVERIGTEVIYESLVEAVGYDSVRLVDHISGLIRERRPAAIVIDSFKALGELVPEPMQWRKLVFELAGLLAAYDVTGFWVGEYSSDMFSSLPEFAIADGILELQRRQSGSRDERYLRVIKLRGSDFRNGEHAFTISENGLHLFPRLVAPSTSRTEPVVERLRTGIDGLDQLIESGWLRGTSTLTAGPSGAGKTILALHFLRQGVAEGEAGLLVNFQESPMQLARSIESLGWSTEELIGPERLDVLYTSPVELQIDTIVQEVLRRIDEHGVRRIAIDALGELRRSASDHRRFTEYVYVLTQEFAQRQITAMLILETSGGDAGQEYGLGAEVSYMSDNVIALSMNYMPDLKRGIRVVKSRASAQDGNLYELRIGPSGMVVA